MPTFRTLCNRCERYAEIGHAYRRWYAVSRGVIHRLADYRMNGVGDPIRRIANRELTVEAYHTLCDLVAITSPRVGVKRGLKVAWGEFNGDSRPSDMIRNTRAALDHYYATDEIRGPKTSRFARVLRGDDSVVVVDSWMARALGIPNGQARNRSSQKIAESVVSRVRVRQLCWSGPSTAPAWTLAETQAAIWAGCIRSHYSRGKIPVMRTVDVGLYSNGPDGRLTSVPF